MVSTVELFLLRVPGIGPNLFWSRNFLYKNPRDMGTAFYSSLPHVVYWPMFIIATLAAIVASQSIISASFSVVKQSMALGCFPWVNMRHTSSKNEGQVYASEINYTLMIICIALVVGFRNGTQIGNAYGKSSSSFLHVFPYLIRNISN